MKLAIPAGGVQEVRDEYPRGRAELFRDGSPHVRDNERKSGQ